MVKQLRIHLLTEGKPVYRDIEIPGDMTLEDLHNAIVQSFGLDGTEMASFYLMDEDFAMTDEIPLFPADENGFGMDKVKVDEVLHDNNTQLAYVYDFMTMWQFLVEQMGETEPEPGALYPRLVFGTGELPDSPPDVHFDTINRNPLFNEDDEFEEFGNSFDDFDNDNPYPDDWY